ncbi:hypothetical protein BDV38DRAFT_280058 [Aspergillus pseudotamarii]|uniref:Uncharacterized protein n=1 Tax=Aspergillus pseudotamarii TaxID=132259 RepID=A0A5N6T2N5_ASPPS|nr:uncharacterized protein BDV38DRAFT_280058 [Aspergillus pseudotamarii]KAE8140560.1 hypothetical protein BDV38DRAFT_280058 [Aspergillus pseudotamarii]
MCIKINLEAEQVGEAKERSSEPSNRVPNHAQYPQVVSGNPQLGSSSTTQKSTMSSTIPQIPTETSTSAATKNHPFDGDLIKWTIQDKDFESASALRTIIHDLERMTEVCNLKLQRLEAANLEFWERQAIELGVSVQAKTEHLTASSTDKPLLKRKASPAHNMTAKDPKKARVQPAEIARQYVVRLPKT